MEKIDKLDRYRYLVSGYYGIRDLDGYDLKPYILLDIENYIRNYVKSESMESFNLKEEADYIDLNHSEREKLNNSLIVLRELEAPMDLVILVKRRLNRIKKS